MNIDELTRINRDEILRFAEARGASNVRVFGLDGCLTCFTATL